VKQSLRLLHEKAARWTETPEAKMLGKAFNALFFIGVSFWLYIQIDAVGWAEVWKAMPSQPLFYVLMLVNFFILPFSEQIIYHYFWKFPFWNGLKVFTLKKIYNGQLVGYSGEVYFFAWVRKELKRPVSEAFKIIKDNNVISTLSSTLVVALILGGFVYSGALRTADILIALEQFFSITAVVITLVLTVLLVKFRRHIISLPWRTTLFLFNVHTLRFVAVQVIQVWQWMIVLPDVPFSAWMAYTAVMLVIQRIPVLPNKDMIFMSLSIGMTGALVLPESEIAALMLTITVTNRVLNFIFFGVLFLMGTRLESSAEDEAAAASEQKEN
jgi:hypothetical protein